MATLTIEGRRIKVDDAFLSLTREQQNQEVEEIAAALNIRKAGAGGQPGMPEEKETGMWANATAGLNEGLYAAAGAPVDLARNILNNLTQLRKGDNLPPSIGPDAALRAILAPFNLPAIPDNSIGGSEWISDQFERAGVNDPDQVEAINDVEKIVRAGGQGVSMTVAPEMALSTLASKVPTLSSNLLKVVSTIFGEGRTAGGMARNAIMGGAGNAGAQAAVESDAIPEQWKPIAALLSGVGTAGLTGAVMEAPNLVRQGVNVARSAAETMTPAGQEQIVGRTLVSNADDAGKVIDDIDTMTAELVPSSKPTTFQQSGDMGLGQLERAARTRDPAAFNQRAAEQNAARLSELESIQPMGAPEKVAQAVRTQVEAIQRQADAVVGEARKRSQQSAMAIGRGKSPDEIGANIRSDVEKARASAVDRENALWEAVDPDRTLALPAANVRQHLTTAVADIPASAKGPQKEEAAIYDTLRQYGEVVPFRELNALRSRLAEAMRDEVETHGRSVAWGRMSQLSNALWKDIEGAVTTKVAQEQQAVAQGRMDPMDTIAAKLQLEADQFVGARTLEARNVSGTGSVRNGGSRPAALSGFGRAEVSGSRGPGNAPRDPRLSGDGLGANFDEAALGRLNTARDATQDRVNVFDNRTMAPLQRRASEASVYAIGDTAIPQRLFFAGPGSKDAIQSLKRAIGDQRTAELVRGHVANQLRKDALGDDMTFDPGKLASFMTRHADALSEFPGLNAQIGTAEKASRYLAQVTKEQKDIVESAQKGQIAKFLGLDDPQDVERTVAAIFRRQDSVQQMRQLREMIKCDATALEGLRKAVVDHMLGNLVSNTEAANSGLGTLKTDMFQRFVNQNEATLKAAGFTDSELTRFKALADDLQRANRSIASVKLSGSSNTAQDTHAQGLLALGPGGDTTMLIQLVVVPAVSAVGSSLGGWAGAAGGALGTALAHRAYMQGIDSTHALLRDALLDPQLAKALMEKVKPAEFPRIRAKLRDLWSGTNVRTTAIGADDEDRMSFEAIVRRAVQARIGASP